jgi:hypothetical protein
MYSIGKLHYGRDKAPILRCVLKLRAECSEKGWPLIIEDP